jgi:hypothetical protein
MAAAARSPRVWPYSAEVPPHRLSPYSVRFRIELGFDAGLCPKGLDRFRRGWHHRQPQKAKACRERLSLLKGELKSEIKTEIPV